VATVSGVIDNSTGAASARALFDNPSGMLRSGNTGQIIIPRVSHDAIVIPQKATYELQDLRYVYTLNDSNITVPTAITIEPYNDGKTYVVTSGLKPGDRIVTEGVGTSVRANMPVTPKTK
ncbi:MAG: efflux RND transporter periplasmic adaptor subunit, partial [Muribaculaceae bacterium]|nr:efflux RND transporter periplasmic adaptor subunit [Muribaculaceae bacterium]